MSDPFDLQRFVDAQADVYADVRRELVAGHKTGHWMWFIFPQMKGLGFSSMADRYGIATLDEARAYLQHDLLGTRLQECTAQVNAVQNRSAEVIFGTVDALKFRSSMTLFAEAAEDPAPFREAIEKYYGGVADRKTLDLLEISA